MSTAGFTAWIKMPNKEKRALQARLDEFNPERGLHPPTECLAAIRAVAAEIDILDELNIYIDRFDRHWRCGALLFDYELAYWAYCVFACNHAMDTRTDKQYVADQRKAWGIDF